MHRWCVHLFEAYTVRKVSCFWSFIAVSVANHTTFPSASLVRNDPQPFVGNMRVSYISLYFAFLQEVLLGLFPGRTDAFAKALQKHKHHLVNYMIFLRVTPLLPSWFINTASPVVGFPFREYIIGTAVGLQPLNFILIQAGQTLATLQSWRDLYSLRNVAKLGACALLAVSPVVVQRCVAARSANRRPSFTRPRSVCRTSSL